MSVFSDIADAVGDGLRSIDDAFGGVFSDVFAFKFFDEPEAPAPPPIKAQIYGATNSRQIVYGIARVGGQVAYIKSNSDESLDLVLVFADHPCESIDDILIDDVSITNGVDDKYNGLVTYSTNITGQASSASDIMYTQTDLNPSRHLFLGVSRIYLRFQYNADVFRGLPRVTLQIKGKNNIYDPRTDGYGYTTNHALCTLDFLTNYIDVLENIDAGSWSQAADYADELVAAETGTEERYTVNGGIKVEGQRVDILTTISGAGNLNPIWQQGIWYAQRSEYFAPVGTIGPDDLAGDIQVKTGSSKEEKFNTAKGTFIDPEQSFEPVDFIAISDPSYIVEDGEELQKKFDFQFHNTPTLSRRVAKVKLEKSRFGLRVTAKCKLSALEYQIGDRVYFDYPRYGWDQNKVFRVENIEWNYVDAVTISLAQDDPAIYDWQEGDAIGIDVPAITNLPNPFFVSEPIGLAGSEDLYFTNVGSVIKTRVVLSWVKGGASTRNYEVEANYDGQGWVTLSDYVSTEFYEFNDAQVGEYQFRVRAVNGINVKSDYVNITLSVSGKTAPPSDVSGFSGVTKPYEITLSWNDIEDIDKDVYELRSGTSWENSTLINTVKGTSFKWELRPNGTERVFIKAIDTTGNYSLTASEAQIIINPPSVPTTFRAQVIDNLVQLFWGESFGSFQIRDYELRRGPTLAGSEKLGDVEGTFQVVFETESGSYNYWVRGRDVNGNTGDYKQVQAFVDQPPDFVLLGNQALPLDDATGTNFIAVGAPADYTSDSDQWTADSTIVTADSAASSDILAPVTTGQSFNDHFESLPNWQLPSFRADSDLITADSDLLSADEGFQTIKQLQLDNNYPYYLQPTPMSGQTIHEVDFLGQLTLARIQVTADIEQVVGTTDVQITIGYSDDGVTYIDTAGVVEVVAKNFRYVRVIIDYVNADDLSYVRLNQLRVKLDVKLRIDSGSLDIFSVDSLGTEVLFNLPFVDIQSIQLTANSVDQITAGVNFIDEPNPTGFKALAWDSSGIRTDATVSWIARGV
jgi:hypothetical protein